MKKVGIFVGLLFSIVLVSQTVSRHEVVNAQGGSGGWVTPASETSWRITQACQNGAYMDMVNTVSDDPDTESQLDIGVTAWIRPYLYPETLDDSYFLTQINEDDLAFSLTYLNSLSPTQRFNYQPDSYAGSPFIDESLSSGTAYYLYKRDNVIRWPQTVPADSIVIFDGGGLSASKVESCLVPSIEVASQNLLTAIDIGAAHDFMNAKTVYTVVDTPAQGDLKLDDVSLSSGDTFTYDQIAGNQVSYDSETLRADEIKFNSRATVRLSVNSNGNQAIGTRPAPFVPGSRSYEPAISADGSKIAFTSSATNLSPVDDNLASDVFLRSLQADSSETILLSSAHGGNSRVTASDSSFQPDISADGRNIAFASRASDLDEEPAVDGSYQIYKAESPLFSDSYTTSFESYFYGESEDIPIAGADSRSPSIIDDGTIAFDTSVKLPISISDENNQRPDVLVNSSLGSQPISVWGDFLTTGNGGSYLAELSDDGELIVFETDANDLILSAEDTNEASDILIQNADGGFRPLAYISVNSSGILAQGGDSYRPQISRFGEHVVFDSSATNLAHNSTTDGTRHVYAHDRLVELDDGSTRICTILLSQSELGQNGDRDSERASISANGRFVAFQSEATNLLGEGNDTNNVSDIFVVDRDVDGDYSFYSDPATCEPGPSRIFRVSIASDGTPGNLRSIEPVISGNGDFVAFTSIATNLVDGDTNGLDDVFLHYIGYEGIIRFQPPTDLLPYKSFLPVTVR